MKKLIIPERLYEVLIFEGSGITKTMSLRELLTVQDSTYEFVYALHDNHLEELLALSVGQSFYFSPNRDNDLGKAIVGRIH